MHSILSVLPAVSTILVLSLFLQATSFTFGGVGLASDFKTVAARYPHSELGDGYIRVSPQDTHDHIGEISISASGKTRFVRIGLEIPEDGKRGLSYPQCSRVEKGIALRYGQGQPPNRFREEAVWRYERSWRSATEVMTLRCFQVPGEARLAEAVVIEARSDPK